MSDTLSPVVLEALAQLRACDNVSEIAIVMQSPDGKRVLARITGPDGEWVDLEIDEAKLPRPPSAFDDMLKLPSTLSWGARHGNF